MYENVVKNEKGKWKGEKNKQIGPLLEMCLNDVKTYRQEKLNRWGSGKENSGKQ